MLQRIYSARRFRYYIAVLLCKMISKLANSVIVETQLSQQVVVSLGVSKSKMSIIPQSPDRSIVKHSDKTNIRNKLGIAENEFIVGYLGKFTQHYMLELIPQAVAIAQTKTKRNFVIFSLLIDAQNGQ